ncbi:hypothetical protein ABPG77_003625 [Micractinium sp. CCAP 211/92]
MAAAVLQTMALRAALLLVASACLASSAFAALPDKPFKNPGGPPFLNGAAYSVDKDTKEINSMGITYEGNYSFVDTSRGDVVTEMGVYTSWECGPEPGSYLALVDVIVVDITGSIVDQVKLCEYGFLHAKEMKNTWADSPDECPTEATNTNMILGGLSEQNTCGTPADEAMAPAPAARRMRMR